MSALWTAAEIAKATNGTVDGPGMPPISGISIDTRTLQPGDLFVALQAERDGHDFVPAALQAGAAGALVSQPVDGPAVLVADTLDGLTAMARASVQRCAGTRIAITGSVGKTSAKDALYSILSAHGRTHRSLASYNNHWGVPLSLARMPQDTDFGIFEIGTNSPGEIAPLSQLVQPHIALITHVAPAHLAGFGSLQEIAREKAGIFTGLSNGGTAIIPADNAMTALLRDAARDAGVDHVLAFGRSLSADVQVLQWSPTAAGALVRLRVKSTEIEIAVSLHGEHWGDLLAAILCVGLALDIPAAQMAAGFAGLHPSPGRGERVEIVVPGGTALLVDDSYNANPTSMDAALRQFEALIAPRKFAILGEMLELGEAGPALHAELAPRISSADLSALWLVGAGWQGMPDRAMLAPSVSECASDEGIANSLRAMLRPGDAVLVKGSNGSRVHRIAGALRQQDKSEGDT